jgi:hypothetical protein
VTTARSLLRSRGGWHGLECEADGPAFGLFLRDQGQSERRNVELALFSQPAAITSVLSLTAPITRRRAAVVAAVFQ